MMNLSMTLFILLLLLLGVAYMLLFKGGKKRFTLKFGRGKGIRNLSIYLLLLAAGTVASLLLTPEPGIKPNAEKKKVSNFALYDLIEEKADKEHFEKYLRNKDTFNFTGSDLRIRMPQSYIETVVDRTGKPGVVEAAYYETPSVVMGALDITSDLPVPEVTLRDDRLTVQMAFKDLKYAGYKPEFPFEQFADKKGRDAFYEAGGISNGNEFHDGNGLIYITVSKNVHISTTDDSPVEYIRK